MITINNIIRGLDRAFYVTQKLPRDFLHELATPHVIEWLERSSSIKRRLINHRSWYVRNVFPLYLIGFFIHPSSYVTERLNEDKEKYMFDLCEIADAIICATACSEVKYG